MSTATENKPSGKPRIIHLRRLIQLMLEDLEIYDDTVVTGKDAKAYGWPEKYVGMTYYDALLDCTAVLLRNVLHHHCPYAQVGAK